MLSVIVSPIIAYRMNSYLLKIAMLTSDVSLTSLFGTVRPFSLRMVVMHYYWFLFAMKSVCQRASEAQYHKQKKERDENSQKKSLTFKKTHNKNDRIF